MLGEHGGGGWCWPAMPARSVCNNTEFTAEPICTASKKYQQLKIKELNAANLTPTAYNERFAQITEKVCLCEGLCTSTYIKTQQLKPKENTAVAICPGPNLAFFNSVYSLDEMVNHIYGNADLLAQIDRPHVFINELNLYIDYLNTQVKLYLKEVNDKKIKYFNSFKLQLEQGVSYYKNLFNDWPNADFLTQLFGAEQRLLSIKI